MPRSAAHLQKVTESFCAVLKCPVMHVGIRTAGDRVAEISYLPVSVPLGAPRNRVAGRAARQLERYLEDPEAGFDLPLAVVGSAYQQRVWDAISAIPRGRTATYGQIARSLGSAPRAIGQACGANRFPLVIPCHRVVGANSLGGFAHHGGGFYLEIKRWLLCHEHAIPRRA